MCGMMKRWERKNNKKKVKKEGKERKITEEYPRVSLLITHFKISQKPNLLGKGTNFQMSVGVAGSALPLFKVNPDNYTKQAYISYF